MLAPRSDRRRSPRPRLEAELEDEARFIKSWFENPLIAGAVAPSGKELAAKMAAAVDPMIPGQIIELGPGTGPVTAALIARGIAPERLILVEYSKDFAKLLAERFPGVTVVQGDAYDVRALVKPVLKGAAAGVVSSLPLLTKPEGQRHRLLETCFDLMVPGAPFVQFTYMTPSPIPLNGRFEASVTRRIWKNLPPARVWTYRRPTT